nr:transglutaminase-like domain-containing protein [Nocardiopsis sinuspersici]
MPEGVQEIGRVVRGVLTHYRSGEFTGARLGEVDHRWVESMLAVDAARDARDGRPWEVGRQVPLVGCCRDFALVTVAALRVQGVAARIRVGFAPYLVEGFACDHVVVEYWDGSRWVWADTQLDPGRERGVDVLDLPRGRDAVGAAFASAAQVWSAYRAGLVDAGGYGVSPESPLRGGWLVRDYVLLELAHRQGDEVLLWDRWGAMEQWGESELVDEVAALPVAADGGDGAAEEELAAWYARDGRLRPRGRVYCASPSGYRGWVDLVSRVGEPAV